VCAVPETNLGICKKLRTYKSRVTSTNPTIVQAIRATCATPALFTPVGIESIGCRVTYVSGAYNFNNPARETIKEAREQFQLNRLVACMLSLGCGQRMAPRLTQSNGEAVMTLAEDIASDCELVDRDLAGRLGQSNIYYRLSVDRNPNSGEDSSLNPIGNIQAATNAFLEHPSTTDKVNACAEAASRLGRVTLTDICEHFYFSRSSH
jgi:predicted acylesterase/phospholipase RssA